MLIFSSALDSLPPDTRFASISPRLPCMEIWQKAAKAGQKYRSSPQKASPTTCRQIGDPLGPGPDCTCRAAAVRAFLLSTGRAVGFRRVYCAESFSTGSRSWMRSCVSAEHCETTLPQIPACLHRCVLPLQQRDQRAARLQSINAILGRSPCVVCRLREKPSPTASFFLLPARFLDGCCPGRQQPWPFRRSRRCVAALPNHVFTCATSTSRLHHTSRIRTPRARLVPVVSQWYLSWVAEDFGPQIGPSEDIPSLSCLRESGD